MYLIRWLTGDCSLLSAVFLLSLPPERWMILSSSPGDRLQNTGQGSAILSGGNGGSEGAEGMLQVKWTLNEMLHSRWQIRFLTVLCSFVYTCKLQLWGTRNEGIVFKKLWEFVDCPQWGRKEEEGGLSSTLFCCKSYLAQYKDKVLLCFELKSGPKTFAT